MKSSLDELMAVLEKLRAEKHPEIPTEVITNIVEIQIDDQESTAARQGRLKSYFDKISDILGEKV